MRPPDNRHHVRHVQQRAAERLGLHQVLGAVRRRDPADHPPTTPPTTPARRRHLHGGAWSAHRSTPAGNEVSYNGHTWKAKWWTQNEEPGTTGEWGVWQDEGAC